MRDQAENLRQRLVNQYRQPAKTIAVVSGKGGVGKSNITINTALSLALKGKKVLIFDFDIGMGNINVLIGTDTKNTISDYIEKSIPFNEIVYTGPHQISYISAGNGFSEVLELDNTSINRLLIELEELQYKFDFILFDMGAGANNANLQVLLSVEDIFVVTTPEPTSITDAYSMMKYIVLKESKHNMYLICNRSEREKEGILTLERLQLAMKKFLNKEVNILGVLPEDSHVRKAVIGQTPFYTEFPRSSITVKLENIVQSYIGEVHGSRHSPDSISFIRKLRSLFER